MSWSLQQSRSLYACVVRGRCREDDPLVIADIKRLATKLEACRKRAKRACISRIGAVEYATEAHRWTGFAAWCRFSLCCFELPAFRTRSQARIWREQREQLTKAFSDILSLRIYAQLDDIEMRRMVTLAASALRRGRYPVGLRGLLREPELHGDLLIGFLEKRLQLVELPGHPVSEWKAAVNRTEKFAAYQRQRSSHVTPPSIATFPTPTPTPATVTLPTPAAAQARPKPLIPIQAEPKLPDTEPPTAATDAEIVLALAAGLWSGVEPSFLEPVRELVRLQICSGFLLQYKKETKAKNLKTLIDELRPPQPMVIVAYDMWAKDHSLGSHAPFATIATCGADIGWVEFDTAQEPANRYAEWLLSVLMSVRSDPGAILNLAQASLSKFRSLQRRER
jgi:hypothetical protein